MTGIIAGSPAPDDLLTKAASAGFPILEDAHAIDPDPRAARMLPSSETALGVSLAGDVLEVVLAEAPSPSRLRQLADASGMLVTVRVTTPDILSALRARLQPAGAAPLVISPAMEEAVELNASDLHLAAGTPPIVRVNGELRALPNWPPLSVDDLTAAAAWIAGDLSAFTGDLDRSVSFHGRRWRVSLYRQRNALAMAMRLIPATPPQVDELGLPASVVNLAGLTSGLVLFCGQTGSGKTTSMAALIDRINQSRACHILTIEDPVEYLHPNRRAIVHQREVGSDTSGFAVGLRSALRQDPDVLLVGELRDLETMATALAAAETGHLVLATVHSSSTASAVTRIVSSFPTGEQDQVRQQLAGSLRAVVFQVLLPSTRGGRTLATEVLTINSAARNIIRDDRLHELPGLLDASGTEHGMCSINRSLARLVASGRITAEIAEAHVSDPSLYKQFLTERPEHDLAVLDPLLDLPTFGVQR
jgi:twitching motility protein PilT